MGELELALEFLVVPRLVRIVFEPPDDRGLDRADLVGPQQHKHEHQFVQLKLLHFARRLRLVGAFVFEFERELMLNARLARGCVFPASA